MSRDDEVLPRLAAAAATLALLALAGRLLSLVPAPAPATAQETRIQMRFVPRTVAVAPLAAGAERPSGAKAPPPSAPSAMSAMSAPGLPAASGPPPRTDAAPTAAAPGMALYDEEGRVRLPADTVAAPAVPATRDPLRPPNPVDYRGTRFEDDWISDGDVADVAEQQIARGYRRVAEWMFGKDVQPARARPAPQVRYNPARHERPSDLGSEATGDAWRAAPISYEPAPGLDGEASRRIRAQVGELERTHAGCDPQRLGRLMAPVRQYLDELQRAEYAFAHGADPIRAEHQLPSTANGAYDQARRALWYAQRELADCRR
ncbi:hypothetical protein B1992_07510 [Pseudoxanthomonas broegbernensis]|uniref:Uncharacterized protein n=1 Tax=Pseudoxanthomonas broegbernensis TaxID=83619 RepID=A0A7V8GMZ7_9GAMM|nr:hypothetical protein [Pseudoxanthomonas broegbernensis]KAF1686758.1 hypothetical protein B1992_07510 [Pseudoxanthomonas broegbernensis]MBB6063492.1 hypothetical protein [Pseudoxanthomonas broegbernensis]